MLGDWKAFWGDQIPNCGNRAISLYHPYNLLLCHISFRKIENGLFHCELFSSPRAEAERDFKEITSQLSPKYLFLKTLNDIEQLKNILRAFQSKAVKDEIEILIPVIDKFSKQFIFQNSSDDKISAIFPIRESNHTTVHVNPILKDSKELISVVKEYVNCSRTLISFQYQSAQNLSRNYNQSVFKSITYHLSHGADPNQTMDGGFSFSQILIQLSFDEDRAIAVLERVSQYGYDVSRRAIGTHYYSGIECAIHRKKYKILTFIGFSLTHKIDKISVQKDRYFIQNLNAYPETVFATTELKFKTILRDLDELDGKQKEYFITFTINSYKDYYGKKLGIKDFNPDMGTAIRDDFKNQDHNMLLEIILAEGESTRLDRLAGINLYQIFYGISEKYKDYILINHQHSVLHKHYWRSGIMNRINTRLSFALRSLYPDQTIVTFYSALTFDTVKSGIFFLKGPKYQFDNFYEFLEAILVRISKGKIKLNRENRDGIVCNINDPLKLSNEPPKEPTLQELAKIFDIHLKLYLQMRGKGYALPEVFLSDNSNLAVVIRAMKKYGIEFIPYFTKYATAILPLVQSKLNKKASNPSHFTLFSPKRVNNFWQTDELPQVDIKHNLNSRY